MSGTRTPTTSRTTTFRPRSLRTGHEHLPRKQRVARLFCSTHAKRRTRSVSPLHTSFSSDSSHDYVYGPSGTPIEQVNEATGAATYLYTDQLGSVVMEADQSGTVTASQAYAPYGEVASTSGTWTTPFGYAGGYTDPTGLIYLINRYYDAQTGQFVSVDPLVGVTQQSYSYAGQDPLNITDVTGLAVFNECRGLIGEAAVHCDVYQYFVTSYAPDTCVKCASFINALLGGFIGALGGVGTAILGGIAGGLLGVAEGFLFVTDSFVSESLHAVNNIIYADLTMVTVECGNRLIAHPSEQEIENDPNRAWFVQTLNTLIAWINSSRVLAQFVFSPGPLSFVPS